LWVIESRRVASRAAHIGIDREARIEEQHPAELDAWLGQRKTRRPHVLRQRLEDLLRLLQLSRVVCHSAGRRYREYRRDTRGYPVLP
jgi:hypothetical protein